MRVLFLMMMVVVSSSDSENSLNDDFSDDEQDNVIDGEWSPCFHIRKFSCSHFVSISPNNTIRSPDNQNEQCSCCMTSAHIMHLKSLSTLIKDESELQNILLVLISYIGYLKAQQNVQNININKFDMLDSSSSSSSDSDTSTSSESFTFYHRDHAFLFSEPKTIFDIENISLIDSLSDESMSSSSSSLSSSTDSTSTSTSSTISLTDLFMNHITANDFLPSELVKNNNDIAHDKYTIAILFFCLVLGCSLDTFIEAYFDVAAIKSEVWNDVVNSTRSLPTSHSDSETTISSNN